MRVLAIYGASGLGREVLELARLINIKDNNWDKFIFIDDGEVPSIVNNCKTYSYIDAKERYGSSLEIVMGIGEPAIREKLFSKIKSDGITTPTLIHPSVHIPDTTKVGTGVVIQYGCFISCNAIINNYVYLQPHCNIGHDDILEEGCILAGFANIGGIVHIGRYAYIGLSSAIKQTVTIGKYSIIGMGAIVHKDIPDGMTAMGNPARVIAKNDRKRVFGH